MKNFLQFLRRKINTKKMEENVRSEGEKQEIVILSCIKSKT